MGGTAEFIRWYDTTYGSPLLTVEPDPDVAAVPDHAGIIAPAAGPAFERTSRLHPRTGG
jgi:hypothetical protein